MIRLRSEFDEVVREKKEMHKIVVERLKEKMHRSSYEINNIVYDEKRHGAEISIVAYRDDDKSQRYLVRLIFAFRGYDHGFPVVYVHVFIDNGSERSRKRILLDVPDFRFDLIALKYYDLSEKKRKITVIDAKDLRDILDSLNEVVRSLTPALYDYDSVPETPDDRP